MSFFRTVFTRALQVLPLMILPSIVLASGGEEAGWRPIWDLIWRIVNFSILAGVLFYFTRKPIANAIRNSIEAVKTLLREALESRQASEARMKEAEEKLAGVDKEISELLASARKESEAERERILAEASEALEKLKAETAVAIEQELKKAKDILKRETADAAVALAEEILSKNITDEDQSKFVSEYLEKLEANQ
jgi:F-type H+-transporting ATPase subunit b